MKIKKSLLLLTVLLLVPFFSYGQIKIQPSKSLTLTGSSFLQFQSYKRTDGYDISITYWEQYQFLTIDYSPSQVESFKYSLIEIRKKFNEWAAIARQNNVQEVEKPIPVNIPNVNLAHGYNLSNTRDVSIKPIFKVYKSYPMCLIRIDARSPGFYRNCEWILNDSTILGIIRLIDEISDEQKNRDYNQKRTEDLFQ